MPAPFFRTPLLSSVSSCTVGYLLPYLLCGVFLLCGLTTASPAQAEVFTVQNEPHLAHARALITAALQAAGMEVQFFDAPMGNERRNVFMVSSGQTDMDMMPATPDRLKLVQEGRLRMIPVPLDRGILGYRVNLLLESQKNRLSAVHSAKDLSSSVMGQNEGWMDIEIYRSAGIPTKEIRNWSNGEFAEQMEAGFIDLFPLGLEETLTYFLPHFRKQYPQLSVDSHILLYYPWFRFVWVSPAAKTDALYEALQRGFDIIATNGVFLETWQRHCAEPEARHFASRRIIQISNPFYGNDLVPPRYQHLLFQPGMP